MRGGKKKKKNQIKRGKEKKNPQQTNNKKPTQPSFLCRKRRGQEMKGEGGRSAAARHLSPTGSQPSPPALSLSLPPSLPAAPLCSAAGSPGEVQSPGAVTAFRPTWGPGGPPDPRPYRRPSPLRSARPGPAGLRHPFAGRGRGGRRAGSLFLLHGGYLNVLLSITRHFRHRRQLPGPHAGAGAPHIMGEAARSPPTALSPAEPLEPGAPQLTPLFNCP